MDNLQLEDLQLNNLYIYQKKDGFKFGTDAVALSNFVTCKKDQKIIDLGTYSGIIPILLSAKTNAKKITGLEIQEEAVKMAQKSVEYNNLQEKIEIINGDICKIDKFFKRASFDIVVTNPPYKKGGTGVINTIDTKIIARHEILCTLEDIIKAAKYLLKDNGKFFMVHKPERLAEIIDTMKKYKIEPKRMQLVHESFEKQPCLILIEGVLNAKPFLNIEKPLLLKGEIYE